MKIAVTKEIRADESRVAVSPETVKKYRALGFEVVVETGAGDGASISDGAFAEAGAEIVSDAASALEDAEILLKVQRPMTKEEGGDDETSLIKPGTILIANMQSLSNPEQAKQLADANITVFAMELVPRISRAQSMDVLSSQSSLAGYKLSLIHI